jgi:hypothetical protein
MYLSVEETFQFLDVIPDGYLVEFGVMTGNTMNRLIQGAEKAGKSFEQVYGFDSFMGIPNETEGVLKNPEWPVGAFDVRKEFKVKTKEEAMLIIREKVERKDIILIDGYFEKSLTSKIAEKLINRASYVHIDVDLYSSSIEVLNFIFEYKILKEGGILRYDDWMWCKEGEAGNSLAHQQMTQKYKVRFNRLSYNVFQLIPQ